MRAAFICCLSLQVMKAFAEAEAHKGVSLIVAYAPCVMQGISDGMSCSVTEARTAVEVGYWPLYRCACKRHCVTLLFTAAQSAQHNAVHVVACYAQSLWHAQLWRLASGPSTGALQLALCYCRSHVLCTQLRSQHIMMWCMWLHVLLTQCGMHSHGSRLLAPVQVRLQLWCRAAAVYTAAQSAHHNAMHVVACHAQSLRHAQPWRSATGPSTGALAIDGAMLPFIQLRSLHIMVCTAMPVSALLLLRMLMPTTELLLSASHFALIVTLYLCAGGLPPLSCPPRPTARATCTLLSTAS
jgi:hypothetical protein